MLIEFGRKDTAFLSNNLVISQFLIKKYSHVHGCELSLCCFETCCCEVPSFFYNFAHLQPQRNIFS